MVSKQIPMKNRKMETELNFEKNVEENILELSEMAKSIKKRFIRFGKERTYGK